MKKITTYIALSILGFAMSSSSVLAGSPLSDFSKDMVEESDKFGQDLSDDNFNGLKLYPNPSTNFFYLTSESGMILRRVAIADMLGNTVWDMKVNDSEPTYKIQVPVNDLKNGIYFVELESNNQRITRKISKE